MSLFLTNYNTHLSMNTRVNTLVYNIFLHVLFQISTNVRNWRYVVIQQPVRTLWDHTLAHAWMDLLSIHEKGYAWVRNVDSFSPHTK